MTPEAQRIAIAEACGWKLLKAGSSITEPVRGMQITCGYCRATFYHRDGHNANKHEHCGPMGGECYGGRWELFQSVWVKDEKVRPLPDYLNDLNAMHEAEKVLTENPANSFREFNLYLQALDYVTCRDKGQKVDDCEYSGYIAFATASQRAEAFLKTIGKWLD